MAHSFGSPLVRLHDKLFHPFISASKIQDVIEKMAERMNKELDGKDLVFICVLNGAFLFTADLMKRISIPCSVQFIRVKSYEGTESSGSVQTVLGLDFDLRGKSVVLLEDIVDSGKTISHLLDMIRQGGAKETFIAALFFKPGSYKADHKIHYTGLELGNEFIVGYGLDYNQLGRNLQDIYILTESEKK